MHRRSRRKLGSITLAASCHLKEVSYAPPDYENPDDSFDRVHWQSSIMSNGYLKNNNGTQTFPKASQEFFTPILQQTPTLRNHGGDSSSATSIDPTNSKQTFNCQGTTTLRHSRQERPTTQDQRDT